MPQQPEDTRPDLRIADVDCEVCRACLRSTERLEAMERQLIARLTEVEHEVERMTAFADLMHGDAYSGGEHARRPVFRVIRGEDGHPPIIAFSATEIRRRVTRPFRRAGLRPALGWGAGFACVAAVSVFLASVVNDPAPTTISSGTYTRHDVVRQDRARRTAQEAARSAVILLPTARPGEPVRTRMIRARIRRWHLVLMVPEPVKPPVGTEGRHKGGSGSSSPTAPPATSPAPSPSGTSPTPNASTPVPSTS